MAVKVILHRRVPFEKESQVRPLLLELRTLAMAQPGYVSGETLMNVDDPEEVLVISTWTSIEKWNAWLNNPRRAAVQDRVDALLERSTYYQVFYHA